MKNLFLSSLMLLTIPFSLQASELLPGSTLKLNSPDGLTDLSQVKVELGVICKYRSGILFPENKSCGATTIQLTVENDGTVKIPSIEKFKGIRASSSKNYELSLGINEGKNWLASLAAYGESLSDFKFDGKTLYLYRINGGSINVSYQGQDFFGTDLPKDDKATMNLSFSSSVKQEYSKVLVVSKLTGPTLWWKENLHSYEGKELLKDIKDIKLENLVHATFSAPGTEKIKLGVGYFKTENYTLNQKLSFSSEVELTNDLIEKLGTIELK